MQIEEKVYEKLKKACEKMKENTKNLEELSQIHNIEGGIAY